MCVCMCKGWKGRKRLECWGEEDVSESEDEDEYENEMVMSSFPLICTFFKKNSFL